MTLENVDSKSYTSCAFYATYIRSDIKNWNLCIIFFSFYVKLFSWFHISSTRSPSFENHSFSPQQIKTVLQSVKVMRKLRVVNNNLKIDHFFMKVRKSHLADFFVVSSVRLEVVLDVTCFIYTCWIIVLIVKQRNVVCVKWQIRKD